MAYKTPYYAITAENLAERSPELWTSRFHAYNSHDARETQIAKAEHLYAALVQNGSPAQLLADDLERSTNFINRSFDDYDDPTLNYPVKGAQAFIVPTRTRRWVAGGSDPYLKEWYPMYPLLRHVNSDVAVSFLAGTPPYIVDSYRTSNGQPSGKMLCAPIFHDMARELKGQNSLELTARILEDTLDLAQKLGLSVAALGATLPQYLFRFAKRDIELDDKNIQLMTGHAGTVWLIGETIKELERQGHKGLNGRVGILGTGSIGLATISYLREVLGYEGEIYIYDIQAGQIDKAREVDPSAIKVESLAELVTNSDTLISAVTRAVDLNNIPEGGFRGVVVIEDSQPGYLSLEHIVALGGSLVWPIGRDITSNQSLTRTKYDYGGFGPVALDHFFGCDMEAYAVWQAAQSGAGNLAVREAVTINHIRDLAPWFGQVACAAPFQAEGQLITPTFGH